MPVQGASQIPIHGGNNSWECVRYLLTSLAYPAVPCAVGVANPRFLFGRFGPPRDSSHTRRCHLAKPSLPAIIGDGSIHLGHHAHGRMPNYTFGSENAR